MVKVHFSFLAFAFVLGLLATLAGSAQETTGQAASHSGTNSRPVADTATSPPPVPAPESPQVQELLREANDLESNGQMADALTKVDTALQIEPNNVSAYDLRAFLYAKKKLWDMAEQDYKTALKLLPSSAHFKFELAELKFIQHDYDAARPGFIALKNDPQLGDLATFKVFLCDLLSRRDKVASTELATMDKSGTSPAYYYSEATWYMIHGNQEQVKKWLSSGGQLFGSKVADLYMLSLQEADVLQAPVVSFMTKTGVAYEQVKAFAENDGLRIQNRTTGTWSTIPYDQLPNDLSSFPEDLQLAITSRREIEPLTSGKVLQVSFTTKQGKSYDHVQVEMEEDGLAVLTPDGWLTIPYQQLPDDLSPFPADLQKELARKVQSAPKAVYSRDLVTFTTKKGMAYEDVRATVISTGLSILTSSGWTTVPFQELPDDLSHFPSDIQKQIAAKRVTPPKDSNAMSLYSFTTKQGKHYDQVKAALTETGLSVLTSDGWFPVSFDQLPDDLSAFPADFRKQIQTQEQKLAEDEKLNKAALLAEANRFHPSAVTAGTSANDVGGIDPEQTDLTPDGAQDCLFGSCSALEGSTLVVGGNGATYVYENNQLKARLCPDADATHTGDWVKSVSISDHTLAICTRNNGVYVWIETATGWQLQAHLDVRDPSTVAIDHDHMVVGTNGKGFNSGPVSFYLRKGGTWALVPRDTLHDLDSYSADLFGHIVAVSGNRALIGAPNWSKASYDNIGPDYSGRVYVERYDGQIWREEAQLAPEDNGVGANQFGASVALTDDFIAVSSSNHDHASYALHHGLVCLFKRVLDSWTAEAPIKSPHPNNDAGFGNGPIVFSQNTLVISDLTADVDVPDVISSTGEKSGKPGTIKKAGAIYVYEDQALQATLLSPDPVIDVNGISPDQYGGSLAVSGDTIAIGAPGKDRGTGVVYVWKRQNNQWQLDAELKGFHRESPALHH